MESSCTDTKELPSHRGNRGERSLARWSLPNAANARDRYIPIVRRNLVGFRVMQKIREGGRVESKLWLVTSANTSRD